MKLYRAEDDPQHAAMVAISALTAAQKKTRKAAAKHRVTVLAAMEMLGARGNMQTAPKVSMAAGELLGRICQACGRCRAFGLDQPEWQLPVPENVIRLRVDLTAHLPKGTSNPPRMSP